MATSVRDRSYQQEVEEDFRETEVFVDRSAFDKCRPQIQPFIDISTLKPYLHKYGLIRGEDDNYQLSDKVAPSVRKTHLFDSLTDGAGNYGHHLLYMCIREAKQSLGHQSAAELLKNNGANQLPTFSEVPQLGQPNLTAEPPPSITTSPPPRPPSSTQPVSGSSSSSSRKEVEILQEEVGPQGRVQKRVEKKTTTTETRFNLGSAASQFQRHTKDEGTCVSPIQETDPDNEHCDVPGGGDGSYMRGESVDSDALNRSVGRRGVDDTQHHVQASQASHAQIKEKVEMGAIVELERDDNQYCFHHVSREGCQTKSALIRTICRFAVGCLNAREEKKVGILVGGIRPESDEKPFVIEGLPFMDPTSFQQHVKVALQRVICSQSGGQRSLLTTDELQMVRITFCKAPNPNKALLLLVTVHPQWNVCRGQLYVSSFPDKNGIRGKDEVFVFSRRSLVEESIPTRVTELQRQLKDRYIEICSGK